MTFRRPQRLLRSGQARGFTLIEVLVSLVVVGLLAAIAMPRLSATKGRGFLATMRSDLRNFAAHEESYFYDASVYTPDLADLQARGFRQSDGVDITIVEATVSGWSVTADHPLVAEQCALFIGTAAPSGPAVEEGEIACQ